MTGEDFGEHEVIATEMIDTLEDMEVYVLDGTKSGLDRCNSKSDPLLGFYSPSHNMMVICTGEVPNWLRFETLVHETVHVIQDARDGLNNDTLKAGSESYVYDLSTVLNKQKLNLIHRAYPQAQWDVEIEAFYFETQPAVVLDELKRWVF